jgi:hypothetical protein
MVFVLEINISFTGARNHSHHVVMVSEGVAGGGIGAGIHLQFLPPISISKIPTLPRTTGDHQHLDSDPSEVRLIVFTD